MANGSMHMAAVVPPFLWMIIILCRLNPSSKKQWAGMSSPYRTSHIPKLVFRQIQLFMSSHWRQDAPLKTWTGWRLRSNWECRLNMIKVEVPRSTTMMARAAKHELNTGVQRGWDNTIQKEMNMLDAGGASPKGVGFQPQNPSATMAQARSTESIKNMPVSWSQIPPDDDKCQLSASRQREHSLLYQSNGQLHRLACIWWWKEKKRKKRRWIFWHVDYTNKVVINSNTGKVLRAQWSVDCSECPRRENRARLGPQTGWDTEIERWDQIF